MLRLTTSDGAIYENSDPLHVIFNETSVIASTVLEWITPPLSQRYLEACAQFKCSEFNRKVPRHRSINTHDPLCIFSWRSIHSIEAGADPVIANAHDHRSICHQHNISSPIQSHSFSIKLAHHRSDQQFHRGRWSQALVAGAADTRTTQHFELNRQSHHLDRSQTHVDRIRTATELSVRLKRALPKP